VAASGVDASDKAQLLKAPSTDLIVTSSVVANLLGCRMRTIGKSVWTTDRV